MMPALPLWVSAAGFRQILASGYFLATSDRKVATQVWVSEGCFSWPPRMNRVPSCWGLSRVTLRLSCLRIFQPGALTWKLLVLMAPPLGGGGADVGVGVARGVG